MKQYTMKSYVLATAMLAQFALYAEPVALTDAVTAAENWIASGEAMGTELSAQAVGAQTYMDDDGEEAVHVVSMNGGGFVVTSTDDEMEPILVYSGTGTFNVDPGSPLAALLDADVRARKAAVAQGGNGGGLRLMSSSVAAVSATDEEADNSKSKWDRLLGRTRRTRNIRLMASSGLSTVSTVCVAPLVKSTWDQDKVSTGRCYNYYTPNNYPCGCLATAMAQVMRYFGYPTGSVSPKTFKCAVDGNAQNLTMKGGRYDWANMPLKPSSANATQREAIGKLTYDCGVAVKMEYYSNGSSACPDKAVNAFKETFGYCSAAYTSNKTDFNRLVTNDLHHSRPVILGIIDVNSDEGHAVVADGYGFSSGSIYYHLNMGWSGTCDLWYNMPKVTTPYASYNAIDGLICKIKPTDNWQKTETSIVTLDRQGGSGGSASVTATYGNAMPTISVPTRSGYTFGGYFSSTGGTGTQYYDANGYSCRTWDKTSDTTLYAKWTALPATYTVTYKPGTYGIGSPRTDTKAQNVALYLQGALFTRNDYTQTGWSTTDGGAKTHDLYGYYTSDASITLYPYWTAKTISLATAVDNTSLVFTTGGNADWYGQVDVAHDGIDAARSGNIRNNQSTWMRTTVEGSGIISFWWKCDTGKALWGSDDVMFYIDGNWKKTINGKRNWAFVSFPIKGDGTHELTWKYMKDEYGAAVDRADCVWVDQVEWTPMVTVTLDAQGGTVASNELKGYVGDEVLLPEPMRDGYIFDSWFTEDGKKIEGISFVLDRTRWLYARWSFGGVLGWNYRDEAFYLNWDISPEADHYSVYRSTTEEWSDAVKLADGMTNRWYFDYKASPGVDYWYWIAAADVSGGRAYSNAVGGRREVSLSVDAYAANHDALSGANMIGVHANTSWKALTSAEWIKLNAAEGYGDGELSYSLSNNFSKEARTGTIVVTAGAETMHPKTLEFSVSQSGWDGSVVTDSDYYSFVAGVPFDGSEIVPDVAEGYSLRVSGLPSGLRYDSKTGRIIGKPTAKAGTYVVTFTATPSAALKKTGAKTETSKITISVEYPTLILETAAWRDKNAAGTVKGGGSLAANRKVTISAYPAKNSVFAGWWRPEGDDYAPCPNVDADYRTKSCRYTTTEQDATILALFATREEDAANLWVEVADDTTEADGTYFLDLGACVNSLSLPKLFVSGLPSGIRYNSKTMTISGKTAKPGVYTVTVKATNASVARATADTTATFMLIVPNYGCEALPGLNPEIDAYGAIMRGAAFDSSLVDCTPIDGWAVSAAGLPAGLKWDAKSGTIVGTPTAKAGAYTVTFTARKKGEKSQVATITLNVVDALPD